MGKYEIPVIGGIVGSGIEPVESIANFWKKAKGIVLKPFFKHRYFF
jgi:hypothetical protein